MKKARTRKSEDASFLDDEPPEPQKPAPKAPGAGSGGGDSQGKRPRWKRWLYWFSVLSVWALVFLGAGLAWIAWDLPDVDEAIAATRQPIIRIVTADGVEIARRGERYGRAVRLEDVPPQLPHAIMATEDRRFYDHFGIDLIGIARAMYVNLKAGGIVQGGSTLTQQAAKNLFLTPKRTLKRKFQEVVLALWLEAKFTKDEIFTIYLNRVYFGQGVYGVDAAARHYFAKPVQQLTTYEAAMLAGMLKGPNRYNPYSNPDLAMGRAETVLANLVAAGYFTQADVDAIKRPAKLRKRPPSTLTPMAHHFTDWVLDQVGDYVTLDRDVNVIVTLNARHQQAAERAVDTMMKKGGAAGARGAGEVAFVALAPDGRVLAMVGGADYGRSKFNRAVQARRQPGSAFKPIVFLAGFDVGLTPETVMSDEPIAIEDWSPSNFKNEYLGPMPLSEAMTRSINTVAVKVSEEAGRDKVRAWAKRLGITAELTDEPSLALGVSEVSLLEMTAAYGAFATGGIGVWPYAISEIQDANGTPLYVRSGGGPGRVMHPAFAGSMNAMLANVLESEFGTGKAARLDRPAAGKTGTSQDYRDAWFVGYTPDLIAGVWMGNDNGTAMKGVTGGSLPARLWKDYMARALKGTPPRPLPAGEVDGTQGTGAGPEAPQDNFEKFIKGVLEGIFGN